MTLRVFVNITREAHDVIKAAAPAVGVEWRETARQLSDGSWDLTLHPITYAALQDAALPDETLSQTIIRVIAVGIDQRPPKIGPNYPWDATLTGLMRDLAQKGLNSNQICANLPAVNGVTPTLRAVRNKLSKLGISTSAAGVGYTNVRRAQMVNRTRPAPVRPQVDPDFVLPDVGEATGLNALAALQPGECKFPINHVGYDDFRFCTAPAMESRPYCQHHWALTHEKPREKTDD